MLVGVREVAVTGPSSGFAGALIRAPVRFQRPPYHSVRRVYPSTAGRPACQAAPSQYLLVCICPSRLPWQRRLSALSRSDLLGDTPPFEWPSPLCPRGPRSGPGYSVPVHHRLIGLIRPTHRLTAISLCGLYAVPSPGKQPFARPASGSALSLTIPSRHAVFSDPGGPPPACTQFLRR